MAHASSLSNGRCNCWPTDDTLLHTVYYTVPRRPYRRTRSTSQMFRYRCRPRYRSRYRSVIQQSLEKRATISALVGQNISESRAPSTERPPNHLSVVIPKHKGRQYSKRYFIFVSWNAIVNRWSLTICFVIAQAMELLFLKVRGTELLEAQLSTRNYSIMQTVHVSLLPLDGLLQYVP